MIGTDVGDTLFKSQCCIAGGEDANTNILGGMDDQRIYQHRRGESCEKFRKQRVKLSVMNEE